MSNKQQVLDDPIVRGQAGVATPRAPVAPPITGEEIDQAFEGARDVLGVYTAMNARCDEFKGDGDNRGRESRKAGALTPDTDVLWQGDCGVILLSDKAFKELTGLQPMGVGDSHVQVAVGEGAGSRHTVRTAEVRVFSWDNAGPLDGPVVVADQPWTLSHPKHQNCNFEAGKYRITYQRQFADDLRRARD